MKLLHNIGTYNHSNYNTREEVLNCNEPLGFDGIYRNVYENQDVLEGKDVYFFVMGSFVGKDNSFDKPLPLEKYCDWNEIMEMVEKYDIKLGWHTWNHPDLTKISLEEAKKEITPPFPMDYFAYPYGTFNEELINLVKEAGFKKAWSVTQGNDQEYSLYRDYV